YTRTYRHTYTAARLQTLDHGAPPLGRGGRVPRRTARQAAQGPACGIRDCYPERYPRRGADRKTNPRESINSGGDNCSDEWARRDSNARPLAPEATVSAQASAKSL